MRRALVVLVMLFSIPRAAWTQSPIGPEFRVNTYTPGSQYVSSVAVDAAGDFVIVWQSDGQDGSDYGIFGQRYTNSGNPLGPEFRVNNFTSYAQKVPAVAADSVGNFVVVWQSLGADGSSTGTFGRLYSNSGAPVGPEFRVNTYTTANQGYPSVAADSAGNFVVTWTGLIKNGVPSTGIFGQRYLSSGAAIGPEFQINTYTTSFQESSAVAANAAGFVVVWQSYQDGDGFGIFAQRFASNGAPLGSEFQVNTYTTFSQISPAIATATSGAFVIVWAEQGGEDGNGYGVFGQRYSNSGAPLGAEFRVNSYTTGTQKWPSITDDSAGNFIVTWTSIGQDGSYGGVFGQRFATSGAPMGAEFRINTYTTNNQILPRVAGDDSGRFVVTWGSLGQDGSVQGIFAQRYGQGAGASLSVNDVSVTEGDTGTVNATFTVALSAAAAQTVTVQYATADGTAVAGADYTASSGTVTFPPGTVSQPVSVPVLGDLLDEDDETFTVNLSNPTNATIADSQGVGTIIDNDPLPSVSVSDCTTLEGNAGSHPCPFSVVLTPASGRTVSVAYATADGTATAGSDYIAANGTVTFPAGSTQQVVNVDVLGDTVAEPDETFFVNLSAPSNAGISDGQGVGVIQNDDIVSLSTLEVSHGTDLRADFAGGTPDLYRISERPLSSYEVLVDDVAGDAVPLLLERLAADGSTVAQTAAPVGTGSALSLRWENTLPVTVNGEHIRLRSPACGTDCGADDVYRLRVYDTTFSLARFNNTGSQITVLVLQNPTNQAVTGHVHFWSVAGAELYTYPLSLGAHAGLVLNTATLPGLQGQGGTLTLAHNAPYAALTGKSVALEPSTGFSFDSPLEAKPR